jgi:biofilm PGA synthesis N-glycosyltransferase PgaC
VTWRLQRKFYDVRYEPRALVEMTVPSTFPALWRQRRRWAGGLIDVLRRHWRLGLDWRCRRQWPVLIEAVASIAWAHAFVVMLAFWLLSLAVGIVPVGASPFPNGWGMLIGSLCLGQVAVGVLLDSRYDDSVLRTFVIAPLYPLLYWVIMSAVTVRSTLPALLHRVGDSPAIWHTTREAIPVRGPVVAAETPVAAAS